MEIKDDQQPLLISKPKEKDLRGGEQKMVWLVPEFCRITGLDERQRSDMKYVWYLIVVNRIPNSIFFFLFTWNFIGSMKMALRPYAQMDPRLRRQRLLDFYNRIQSSDENKKIIDEWGLQIQPNLVKVEAYCFNPEKLTFGDGNVLEYISYFRIC